jgi:hypothetical protein
MKLVFRYPMLIFLNGLGKRREEDQKKKESHSFPGKLLLFNPLIGVKKSQPHHRE